jgi:dGTP triphosphohydrolase
VEDLSLEAQICRISDAVAYLNHDLADAFRAGVMSHDRLPGEVAEVLGTTHAERINAMSPTSLLLHGPLQEYTATSPAQPRRFRWATK